MVFGVELQDLEFDAVCVIIVQGDLLQVESTGGAHGGAATTKPTCVLYLRVPPVGQERRG